MLAAEVTEESDRLSPLQVTTSVGPRSSLHHNNRGSARHTASLRLSLVSIFQFCGRLVDHGQLKQSPHPTPACCHIKPDLHRLTPVLLRAYVVVLANGKEGTCRRERGTNSWCRQAGRERESREARGEEGEELKRVVAQSWNLNSCQTIVRRAALPAAVLLIFPTAGSPSTSVLIPRLMPIWSLNRGAFLVLKKKRKKSGHTLTCRHQNNPVWYIDMSWDLNVQNSTERQKRGGNNPRWVHAGCNGRERRGS